MCGGRGRILLTPAENGGKVPAAPFIGACCYNDIHTGVEAQYLVVNKPLWQGMLTGNERFACPGCGRLMHHSWATTHTGPRRR